MGFIPEQETRCCGELYVLPNHAFCLPAAKLLAAAIVIFASRATAAAAHPWGGGGNSSLEVIYPEFGLKEF